MKFWGKLKIEDRIICHHTVDAPDFAHALVALCDHFDLSKPVVCAKHTAELGRFFRTVFYADDFVENVSFDTLEVEIISESKKRKNT